MIVATPTSLLPILAIAHPDTGSEINKPIVNAKSTLPSILSDIESASLTDAIRELQLPKHSPSMKNILDIAMFLSFICVSGFGFRVGVTVLGG
ncbi:hypothetical protein BRY73_17845 [Ochrobactrum sp. P6BS-III]|uniref:hypothetical protein n=1 Tax=unclassified Ochrobactrum TaxID=239106 RepID=UPI000992294B|nr:hypothetical protein [Ochrobactrum sp. P6BSIII]OOL15650.1 hypothetical protein BRY73_17845 [Ochrobactrum sp. P6BS-III]